MKAIVRAQPGKQLTTMLVNDLESGPAGPGQIKVRMTSSRVNPVDVDLMAGFPGLKYKQPQIGGIDGAGEVIEVGPEVTTFAVGDRVFFYRKFSDIGSWAQEIVLGARDAAKIPAGVSLQDAGAIALPLLTAFDSIAQLQARSGERILIHGAGGGVGFMAVQIAKAMGLHVIANASGRDRGDLERIGVDRFIDYKQEDFAQVLIADPPDYIFDVVGGDTLKKSLRLGPKKVVSVMYADTTKLQKTGVELPVIFKFMMKLMMRKFRKAAERKGVELIGQVTGADGALLQKASDMLGQNTPVVRDYKTITLEKVRMQGFPERPAGLVILF